MNRRNFLGLLAGTAAAWPFRKYFIPPAPRIDSFDQYFWPLSRAPYPGRLEVDQISAVELEEIRRELPDLLLRNESVYRILKSGRPFALATSPIQIPQIIIGDEPMVKDLVLRGFDPSWPATTKRT